MSHHCISMPHRLVQLNLAANSEHSAQHLGKVEHDGNKSCRKMEFEPSRKSPLLREDVRCNVLLLSFPSYLPDPHRSLVSKVPDSKVVSMCTQFTDSEANAASAEHKFPKIDTCIVTPTITVCAKQKEQIINKMQIITEKAKL